MTTLEEIEKSITEAAQYHLYTPNTEANLYYIKSTFTNRLRELYFNGFKICDKDGDPIDNVEDCEIVITMNDEYTAYASFGPTEEYWNRKLERYARNFEELVTTLYTNAAMESFDPSI